MSFLIKYLFTDPNIAFAFSYGEEAAIDLAARGLDVANLDLDIPIVNAAMITAFSPQERNFAHDRSDFFHFPKKTWNYLRRENPQHRLMPPLI